MDNRFIVTGFFIIVAFEILIMIIDVGVGRNRLMDNRFIVTGFFVIISFEILILAAIMIIDVGV